MTSFKALHSEIKVIGLDVFVVNATIPKLEKNLGALKLVAISNRGTQVWPDVDVSFDVSDVFRCRYRVAKNEALSAQNVMDFLRDFAQTGYNWVHLEKLLAIDDKEMFSQMGGI